MTNLVQLPTTTLRLSFHARRRMTELHVNRNLVTRTASDPLIRWPARNGCTEFVGHRIVVTIDLETGTVVTVKLRTDEPYQHGVHYLGNLPA